MKTLLNRLFSKALMLGREILLALPAFLFRLAFVFRKALDRSPPPPKTVLVVRVDAIGDYILFRNVLRSLKDAPQYAGYRFSLLGNVYWRPLAEALDGDVFDEFLWIEPTRYSKSAWYRAQTSHRFVHHKFETLIHPPYSRTYWSDRLVRDLSAMQKIAGAGDSVNNASVFDISKRTYTQFVAVSPAPVLFEFQRNKEFAERLLGVSIGITAPVIDVGRLPSGPRVLPGAYAAFHMDASRRDKEWPLENFARLARFLVESASLGIVLLGKKPATETFDFASLGDQVKDLRDKPTLVETARILSGAELFVGNDSALLHLALAVGVKSVVGVAFGQHFGRFVPYPDTPGRRCFVVFPPRIMDRLGDVSALQDEYSDGRFEDIREIRFEVVLEKVQLCLQKSRGKP